MRLFLCLSAILILGACTHQAEPMGKPLPDITYSHLTPLMVNDGAVEIKRSYALKNPQEKRSESIDFVMPLDVVLSRYLQNRFVTTGDIKGGVIDMERVDTLYHKASNRIDDDIYQVDILISITPSNATPTTLTMKKSLPLKQSYTLAEREFRQFEFIELIISELDVTINDLVKNKL